MAPTMATMLPMGVTLTPPKDIFSIEPRPPMNKPHLTAAEATDRHGRLAAVCMAIGAVLFGANAAERIASGELERFLDIGQIALVVLIALMLIPALRWKFVVLGSLAPEERRQYFAADSYMVHTLKRARAMSWALTFAALVVLGIVSKFFPDVPAKFFLDAALAVMFGVFAVTVLVLDR